MHDSLVVAFKVPRPWPAHHSFNGKRWWPPLVTVWHREPGGHDSGEVCKHYRRVFDEATRTWELQPRNGWRWHLWHYHLQVHPLQDLRRWALTRCAWCGGRSRKGDYVNTSHSWDGPRGRWWQGAPGVFHGDCSSVSHAHSLCLCRVPAVPEGLDYGKCRACGKFRPYGHTPDAADRLLAALPAGSRITPDVRPAVEVAWAQRRARKEAAGER